MLARYTMYRGARPAADPLPEGHRQDTRKHTRHVLRPTAELVEAALGSDDPARWAAFAAGYRALLEQRFAAERDAFDQLAALARRQDVFLGCSCPTRKQPEVTRCHTFLALQFMAERYRSLAVRLPARGGR